MEKKKHQYFLSSPFAFKTPVLHSAPAHSFSGSGKLGCFKHLGNFATFFCGFRLSQCLLSVCVIPDWLHDVLIRALWKLDHPFQVYLILLSLKIVLYDSSNMFGLVVLLQNESGKIKVSLRPVLQSKYSIPRISLCYLFTKNDNHDHGKQSHNRGYQPKFSWTCSHKRGRVTKIYWSTASRLVPPWSYAANKQHIIILDKKRRSSTK